MALRAIVENGRLVVDEPTTLPEGTVLDLVVDEEGDDLDDDERALLHARLDAAWAFAKPGTSLPRAKSSPRSAGKADERAGILPRSG